MYNFTNADFFSDCFLNHLCTLTHDLVTENKA